MTQQSFLSKLCASNEDATIVGSLGTISYDLSQIDHPKKILIKGAMGAAIGCGLGLALYKKRPVIVIIGDGSFLMKLGSLSTVLRHSPSNLRIIVLNNGCYKSCGGQKTNFHTIKNLLPESIEVYDVD